MNLTKDTLYTFLPDYKNYYYLINEDIIVPKSIGESMDKSCRRPATRRDCKVASEDIFLPLPGQIQLPESKHIFYKEYGDKKAYLSVKEIDSNVLVKIARYMLKH